MDPTVEPPARRVVAGLRVGGRLLAWPAVVFALLLALWPTVRDPYVATFRGADLNGHKQIALPPGVMGGYDYRLKLILSGVGTAISDVGFRTTMQHNATALPRLKLGRNQARYTCEPDSAPVRATFHWLDRKTSPLAVSLNATDSWLTGMDYARRLYAARPGSPLNIAVTLSRQDGKAIRGTTTIEGLPKGWAVTPARADFAVKGEPAKVVLTVTPPLNAPRGLHAARLIITPGALVDRREVPITFICAPDARVFEAESATKLTRLVVRTDIPQSSGGACLRAAKGKGSGLAEYNVTVNKSGKYRLWVRTFAPGVGHGWLGAQFDGGRRHALRGGPPVHRREEKGLYYQWYWTPAIDLTAGDHKLTFLIYDDGTVADAVLLVPAADKEFDDQLTMLLVHRRFRLD